MTIGPEDRGEALGRALNEAVVREVAAEVADTGSAGAAHGRPSDAAEVAEQFANLANTMSEYVVDSLERSVASRPLVSLAAAAGAGFLFAQWSLGGRR
jgi:hypothetical protein